MVQHASMGCNGGEQVAVNTTTTPPLPQPSRTLLALTLSCMLLVLALVTLLLPHCVIAAPPATVNVGVVGDITSASIWPILCAIDEINNSTTILPNTHINLIYTEAGPTGTADQANVVTKTTFLLKYNPAIIVGARFTDDTKIIAWMAASRNIPQVSFASGASEMLVKADFPQFSRVFPDTDTEVGQIIAMLQFYSWKKVGVLYTSDVVGVAMFNTFGRLARERGIHILTSTVIADATATVDDMAYNMGVLASSKARIFVELCIYPSLRPNMLEAQVKAGLRKEGIQWIGSHRGITTAAVSSLAKFINSSEIRNSVEGQLNVFTPPVQDRPVFQALTKCITNYPSLATNISTMKVSNYNKQLSGMAVPGSLTAGLYDSIMLVGHALHTMIEVLGLDPSNATQRAQDPLRFTNVIRNTSFIGASGDIALNYANGDVLIPWTIQQDGGIPSTLPNYTLQDGLGTFIPINRENNEWQFVMDPTRPFRWKNNIVPVDSVERGLYENSPAVRTAMIVSALFVICLILGTQGGLAYYRDLPIIKGTSHLFSQLSLVGTLLLASSVIARNLILNAGGTRSTINEGPVHIDENGSWANEDLSWQTFGLHSAKTEVYLINLGYYMLVGALLVKTWRVDRIFNQRRMQMIKIGDEILMMVFSVLVLCELIVLISIQYGDPIEFELREYDDSTDIHIFTHQHGDTAISFPIIYTFRFLILLPTCIFTFLVRNTPAQFNEALQLLVTVYNLAFMSILLPIIEVTLNQSTDAGLIAHGVAIFFIVLTTVVSLVAPKFTNLFAKAQNSSSNNSNHKSDSTKVASSGSSGVTGSGVTGVKTSDGTVSGKPAFPAVARKNSITNTNNTTHSRSQSLQQQQGQKLQHRHQSSTTIQSNKRNVPFSNIGDDRALSVIDDITISTAAHATPPQQLRSADSAATAHDHLYTSHPTPTPNTVTAPIEPSGIELQSMANVERSPSPPLTPAVGPSSAVVAPPEQAITAE